MNDISSIIARLEDRRHSIDRAISALNSVEPGSGILPPTQYGMSAAGRKRMSEAAKAYWAAKRTNKSNPESRKRTFSAATRKRMKLAQQKRWAAVRSQSVDTKKAAAKRTPVKKAGNRAVKKAVKKAA